MPSLSEKGDEMPLVQSEVTQFVPYDPVTELLNATPDNYPMDEEITEPSWLMFEKVRELGVGSFGVVYLVKCLQNSVVRTNPAETNNAANPLAAAKTSTTKKNGGSFLGGSNPPGVTTRSASAK